MTQIVTRFEKPYKTTLAIGIGNGLQLAVKESTERNDPRLTIDFSIANESVDLGAFTTETVDRLIAHLQQFRIYAS